MEQAHSLTNKGATTVTPEVAILNKLFSLTRGDLEGAHFPPPQLAQTLAGMYFIRLKRIARFWQESG